MAQSSKNSRTGSAAHKFLHNEGVCGGEIKMRSIFKDGKMMHLAECDKCKQQERRPSDFK